MTNQPSTLGIEEGATDDGSLSVAGWRKRLGGAAKAGWIAGACFGFGLSELIANVATDGDFSNPYLALVSLFAGGIGFPLVIRAAIREAKTP